MRRLLCMFAVFAGLLIGSSCSIAAEIVDRYVELQWRNVTLSTLSVIEPTITSCVKTHFDANAAHLVQLEPQVSTSIASTATVILTAPSTYSLLFHLSSPHWTFPLNQSDSNGFLTVNSTTSLIESINDELTLLPFPIESILDDIDLVARVVPDVESSALGPFPALTLMDPPVNGTTYMKLDVNFGNLQSPSNVTQSSLLTLRAAMASFMNASIDQLQLAGPPVARPENALLVSQSIFFILQDPLITVEKRTRLANLLVFGDALRPTLRTDAQGVTMEHPLIFLDLVPPPSEVVVWSVPIDARMSLPLMYMFNSIAVDQFPPGNPPAPANVEEPNAKRIPAVSEEEMRARMRKRHQFVYDVNTAEIMLTDPTLDYPAKVDFKGASTCEDPNMCVYLYWHNALNRSFWLESIESVERLWWTMYPDEPLCSSHGHVANEIGVLVIPGNISTPVWQFSPGSGKMNHMDFGLYLRSADDNITSLRVEITAELRSAMEAATVVTSIAEHMDGNSDTVIFNTRSNIKVTYESLFRNQKEIFLFLQISESNVTQADTSQPCGQCEKVLNFCQGHELCQPIHSCLFENGIHTDPNIQLHLENGTIGSLLDVTQLVDQCLMQPEIDFQAMMLVTSGIRCQLLRMCPWRTLEQNETDPEARILMWNSQPATIRIQTDFGKRFPRDNPVVVNVFVKDRQLCSISIDSSSTSMSLEEVFPRECVNGNYFGQVEISTNISSQVATTPQLDQFEYVDFTFHYIVGPLPRLELAEPSKNDAGVSISVVSVPQTQVLVEYKNFATILPPIPSKEEQTPCEQCLELAMDGCLRDERCMLFTDCITRFTAPGNDTPIGDLLTYYFERGQVGESMSLAEAIDACHSIDHVGDSGWAMLRNASACYSKNHCPIGLSILFPQAPTAAKWNLNPSSVFQTLIYTAPSSVVEGNAIEVPMEIPRDGSIQRRSSSIDPEEMEEQLRLLLSYSDVDVELEEDLTVVGTPRTIRWNITYHHWIGKMPIFVPSNSTEWTLFSVPLIPARSLHLEMHMKANLTTNSTDQDSEYLGADGSLLNAAEGFISSTA